MFVSNYLNCTDSFYMHRSVRIEVYLFLTCVIDELSLLMTRQLLDSQHIDCNLMNRLDKTALMNSQYEDEPLISALLIHGRI
jgi:hypothetical protein